MPRRRQASASQSALGACLVILTAALSCSAAAWGEPSQAELDLLGSTLGLGSGMVVADVGAGDGEYTLWVARTVSPGGRVYSTEIDPAKLKSLTARVREAGLEHVTVVEAGISETGLPEKCCDAIFMRGVYHHLTDPAAIDASLLRALRPGGLLAVIDFPPALWLWPWTPKGIPGNRGGHGIASGLVVEELTAQGFELVRVINDWPAGWLISHYCALFRRPLSDAAASAHGSTAGSERPAPQ